jgi:ubiquinone/menaquinone biosynthesis C-methylase UbiE
MIQTAGQTKQTQDDGLSQQLLRMLQGYFLSQVVHVFATLGIADHLTGGPKTSDALARLTASDSGAMRRLLRTGVGFGLLEERHPSSFALLPLGALLRSDAPGSLRDYIIAMAAPSFWLPWGQLERAIQHGKESFTDVFGMNVWDYYAQHPQEGRHFANAMSNISAMVADEVVAQYDVSTCRKIVDIGGSHGTLLAALLRANPAAKGVLFDRPNVIAEARHVIHSLGLNEHVELVEGDFFEEVPAGADLYLLKWILHDWDDAQSLAILRNIHRVAASESKLLIVERLLPSAPEPSPVHLMDLNMLVLAGGRERSREEFETLLSSAGYRLERIMPLPHFLNLIEAVRV